MMPIPVNRQSDTYIVPFHKFTISDIRDIKKMPLRRGESKFKLQLNNVNI